MRNLPATGPALSQQRCADAPLEGPPGFDDVYERYVDYVWRISRRLGVTAADTDDVVQEVFCVVHRRLADFEGRAPLKTWLYKIVVHVVRHYRRTRSRKPGHQPSAAPPDFESFPEPEPRGPGEAAEHADAVRVLDGLLRQLDDDKREVFVLAEIEQMTAWEISQIIDINANTVYSRLRAARQDFEQALVRFRARETRGRP